MSFQNLLLQELKIRGAKIIHFVDISQIPRNQNKNFPSAVLFGIPLSQPYLKEIRNTPLYVEKMKQNGEISTDEFHLTELKTDQIADDIEYFLRLKGFEAYSQSEKNIVRSGFYNKQLQTTPLPHKTIASLAGLGWIGKHNLLVTPKYGSAISMCSVLTNAPLETVLHQPQQSLCGSCTICKNICVANAIKGTNWSSQLSRNELIDVTKCLTCLECMVHCPFTQKYIDSYYSRLP